MSVEEYLQLPYTIEVIRDNNPENQGWVARVIELPGCITQGDNFEELGEMIQDAMRGWIEVAMEDGMQIPEPRQEEEFSGKFIIRVPKSLHRRLVTTAEREGTSLNQFIITALSGAVGSSAGKESISSTILYDEIRNHIKEAVKETIRELEIIAELKRSSLTK
jgi:antitoxin HicB